MSTSSIDDLLVSSMNTTQPDSPEMKSHDEPEQVEEIEPGQESEPEAPEYETDPEPDETQSEEPAEKMQREYDDYGNEKEPENEVIRERLARQARKHQAEMDSLRAQLQQQGASPQVQQAAKDFEYDPEASGDWQQQLASFVKQTVNSMTREQAEAQQRQQEQQLQREFETKFHEGMGKFNDFVEVIDSLPCQITDAMTVATRAMSDPAAFLYAAAKRNPQELDRISKIRDPYAQMTEMGKLEERMRKNKPTTKAPRPLGKSTDDASLPVTKKRSEPTIEEMIHKSEAKKLATLKARRGR